MEIAGMTNEERQELVADLRGSLTGDSHIRIRAADEIERLVARVQALEQTAMELEVAKWKAERERDAAKKLFHTMTDEEYSRFRERCAEEQQIGLCP